MNVLEARATSTVDALRTLSASVEKHLGADRDRIIRDDTTIYVVGSGGRGEMSSHSDVDLFVARVGREASEVDAFQVRQAIARALFEQARPDPSQGGGFLKMHTEKSLCDHLGTPQDDAVNTFTARMLLLLESRPLLGNGAYKTLLESVVEAYWTNQTEHTADYQPFLLVNDIVRYWRILLLNYAAKNTEKQKELVSERRDGERRLRSYKLRFSRCITCFSTLSALLTVTSGGGVRKDDVLEIASKTPTERLRFVESRTGAPQVADLLKLYAEFLRVTDADKATLTNALTVDDDFRTKRAAEGRRFGDTMFLLLMDLGREGRAAELFRHMVV